MFRDNNTIVENSINPHGNMHERHVTLSFHRVREEIATKIVNYLSIDRKNNPAYMSTKHWAHHDIWPTFKTILFCLGVTMECLANNSLSFEDGE